MDTENRVFFIVSAPRSASTAIATIFGQASNCRCEIEPDQKSKVVSRLLMDGKKAGLSRWIKEVRDRVHRALATTGGVYGEKDVTYGPMIPWLYEEFGCRFLYLVRNRSNAINSMLRWHKEFTGCLYRECKDRGPMSARALANEQHWASGDLSDYSRPRPRPGDPEYISWPEYSLREMCMYYYSRLSQIYEAALCWVPPERRERLLVSSPYLSLHIMHTAERLGLKGLTRETVEEMLKARINSIEWRLACES